jgi:hypothetical protein
MASAQQRTGNFWLYVTACGLMIVGAFGPWATALGGLVKRSGVDGGDGWILVIGAAVAVALLVTGATKRKMIAAAVVGALCSVVAIYDLTDAKKIVDDAEGLVDVGWGLYLSVAASVAVAVQALRVAAQPALVGAAATVLPPQDSAPPSGTS